MRYCIDCGQPLKKLVYLPDEIPNRRCENTECAKYNIEIIHADLKLQEPYFIVKIRGLHARMVSAEAQLANQLNVNENLRNRIISLEEKVN